MYVLNVVFPRKGQFQVHLSLVIVTLCLGTIFMLIEVSCVKGKKNRTLKVDHLFKALNAI